MMLRQTLILWLFTTFLSQVQGQSPNFSNFYNMSGVENVPSIGTQVINSDSQFVVTGLFIKIIDSIAHNGIFLSAFDIAGNLRWKREIYAKGVSYFSPNPNGLKRLQDGSYMMAGYVIEFGGVSKPLDYYIHGYLIKFNANGDTLWHRTYRNFHNEERFLAITEDIDGNLLIAGSRGEGSIMQPGSYILYRDNSVILRKLDSAGTPIWDHSYFTSSNYKPGSIIPHAIISDPNAGILIGTVRFFGGVDYSPFVFKVGGTGQVIQWQLKLGSENADYSAFNVIPSISGGYIFIGSYTSKMGQIGSIKYPEEEELYYGKFSEQGDTVWTQRFFVPNDTIGRIWGYDIKETDKNEIILLGVKVDSSLKALVVKTDNDGNLIWQRQFWTYNLHTVDNIPASLDLLNNGGIVFTGQVNSTYYYPPIVDTIGQFMWLVRTDSLGCVEPGCDSADYTGVQVIFPPGHNEANLRLHPNPATDWITATFDKDVAADKLRVFDLAGREVLSGELGAGSDQTTWSVSGLSSGVYIVALRNKGKTISAEKLVVH